MEKGNSITELNYQCYFGLLIPKGWMCLFKIECGTNQQDASVSLSLVLFTFSSPRITEGVIFSQGVVKHFARMRCRVFQKYPVHRLVTKLPAHRHAAFWNARHAVICRAFQKWLLNASSRDSGRYVDAVLKHTATPKIHQMASRFKTFIIPSLREIWGTSSTKRW